MTKLPFLVLFTFFSVIPAEIIQSQNKIPFGKISYGDLENAPYKPDPGADAIILSDEGIASLNYNGNEFYVELVRDVKIRIVNSNGYDYANIQLPFSSGDDIMKYTASTFNMRDGEIVETPIAKKNFIIDRTSKNLKILKFNFPDVHEGSVLEYSYTANLKDYAVNIMVPWKFQSDIPVVKSILTIAYPEYFKYKSIISGSAMSVFTNPSSRNSTFFRENVITNIMTYYVQEMPAFKEEPLIKSSQEHLTKIDFELAGVDFPGSSFEEINPAYENLSEELLKRTDFGMALSKTGFLKQKAAELTTGLTSNTEKIKKIHEYISAKILWNGVEDFTASAPLKKIYLKEKGNSADINLLLIGMLRSAEIKADPVILSTRSNGSINQYSAMMNQFNYVLAYVYADGNYFLVDATDPLRPFNVLPFECLNDIGRLIVRQGSQFVDLKNGEKNGSATTVNLIMDDEAVMTGEIKTRYSDYNAYNIRKLVILEGKEGYLDLLKASSTELEIKDFSLDNLEIRDSDVVETVRIRIINGIQKAGESYLFNPFLSPVAEKNIFWKETRSFPIDFGAPVEEQIVLKIRIPAEYSVTEIPADNVISLGKGDGSYEFICKNNGNEIWVTGILKINRTLFQPSEYSMLQNFYSHILQKQAELIVMKKNEK